MKRNSILLCLFLIIAANIFTTAKAQAVDVNDSLALVDLYNSTNGPGWTRHDNWLVRPVKTWYGITVKNGRVTEIHFYYNNLVGFIPVSIGNLTGLTYLYLNSNNLNDTIPASIGNLTNLTYLELGFNELTGVIPASIGNLTKLGHLYLDVNNLKGSIPSSIGNLTQLYELSFGSNQLTGTIPNSLGNLINISSLGLDHNQLTGHIPSSFGRLERLRYLYLTANKLTGEIPDSFLKLKALVSLYAYNNQLTQNTNLPVSNHIFPNLQDLIITYNRFTFNGLEALANQDILFLDYRYQAPLAIHQSNNTLSVSAGGTLSKNTYRWFKVGQTDTIVIKGDSTFHPAESGKCYAQIRNIIVKKLILTTDTFEYNMPLTLSPIAPLTAKTIVTHFSIYPNPATNIIHIQTNGAAIITITNTTGKTLLTKIINNSDVINVSKYANGIYYIQNKTTGEAGKVTVVH